MDTGQESLYVLSFRIISNLPFCSFLMYDTLPLNPKIRFSPNPRVPAGVSAFIDVAAANVSLEVLVAPVTGTGVGPVAVAAGRVLTTVGQGGP